MKSIIITGASRGIGKALAIALSKEYEYVAICSRTNMDALREVSSIISKNCTCRCFQGDVSDYDFVSLMVNTVISEAGEITTLINNAGISITGLFVDMTKEQWQNILDTNISSIYNTCHQVLPNMIHNKSGQIINVSSVWGLVGASCEVAYSATKGAINSFTKALAKELAPSNVSVNAVAFGAIDTDMNKHLDEAERDMLCEEIPYGRMATPEEAADCIINLLNMPPYFTGEIIKFDGAWI